MPRQRPLRPRIAQTRTCGRVLAAALALCLAGALAGCGQTVVAGTARPTSTLHATPTSTRGVPAPATPMSTPALTIMGSTGSPAPGAQLAWRHANLPSGFGMFFDGADLYVAASDGQTAYSCGLSPGASHLQVIVTHDRGASWTRVSDLPFSAPGGCQSIRVDALNPDIVEVCCGDLNGYRAQAISTDGGGSWRVNGGAQTPLASQLATRGSRTYAILGFEQVNGVSTQLGVSEDGLRTWHVLDASLHNPHDNALWLNPTDGSVLLETWPENASKELWLTRDDGVQWSKIPVPLQDVVDYAVQQPLSVGQPWHICGEFSNSVSLPNALACTSDSGQTWTEEPALDPCGTYCVTQIVGLPQDGSLLIDARLTASGDYQIYRLPAGASRWQSLGAMPAGSDGGCTYAQAGAGGALWTFPAESAGAGAPEATDAIYSAAYPY